jgi:hypothetical protein
MVRKKYAAQEAGGGPAPVTVRERAATEADPTADDTLVGTVQIDSPSARLATRLHAAESASGPTTVPEPPPQPQPELEMELLLTSATGPALELEMLLLTAAAGAELGGGSGAPALTSSYDRWQSELLADESVPGLLAQGAWGKGRPGPLGLAIPWDSHPLLVEYACDL